ncbi:MAG: MtnX-like HAD-IB family phosphatase [Actinobacteria bacterium]|nr:MtnX-like HAD-IB family phosphatase [Actinomycetota bacterium]
MGKKSAPELEQRRSIVIDFDGTITQDDLLDEIARLFGDPAVYEEVEDGLDAGTMPLREVITREFAPVTAPLEEVVAWVLDRVRIRPGFADFVRSAQAAGWDVHVVSSGFEELISPVLEREGVDVELHGNRVDARPEGWIVDWRYPDGCDECNESCKRSLLPASYVVYIGDGYSDRCAARASDRVFATRGLATYLADLGTPFEPFEDFRSISQTLANEMAS